MSMNKTFGRAAFAVGIAIAVLGSSAPVEAQSVDARWLPWMGCWQPATEGTGVDLVCLRPAEQQGGVELLRIVDDAVAAREVLWADGQRHDTSRETCEGWEEGSFSEDGRRLFLRGEYSCDGTLQEVGGVIAMAGPAAWVDVRVAGMGGERVAWVQRYQTASAEVMEAAGFGDILADRAWSVATARMMASAPMDVDDVIEAAAMLPDEAVEALLAERGDVFDLTADDLLRMADAGLSDDVIDVAVAVSYPDRFRLNTGQQQQVVASALDTGSLRRRYGTSGYGPSYYDPFYSPFSLRYGYGSYYGYGYSRYGYGGYGYSPYGGGYYGGGFYGGTYGYRPTVVVVDQAPRDHGRMIRGRGYSRGGAGSSSGGSGAYVPRSTAGGGSTAGRAGSSTAGSTSSRGTATGRTAKPRGGR